MRQSFLGPITCLLVVGCVSVPAPATRSPLSPAHPAAPEAATPPATPVLMSQAEEQPSPVEAAAAGTARHDGHGAANPSVPVSTDAAAGEHTCPMHPAVKADRPGVCPICGMTLVKLDRPR